MMGVWRYREAVKVRFRTSESLPNFLMDARPELIRTTPNGGTIHQWKMPGGHTVFNRYLGCYLGSCKFCDDIEEASDYISALEVSSKALDKA